MDRLAWALPKEWKERLGTLSRDMVCPKRCLVCVNFMPAVTVWTYA
jgi:hypothetical protein